MIQDYRTFNEAGFLSDILGLMAGSDIYLLSDIGKKILSTTNNEDPMDFTVTTNIAKAASKLTATFPVLVTEATPVDQAVMVSKAIERKAVALLQMLFAANQITNAASAQKYLNRFYKQSSLIDLSDMDVDDIIDYTNKLSEEFAPDDPVRQAAIQEAIQEVINECKYGQDETVVTANLNETSINDYKVKQIMNEVRVWNQTTTTTTREKRDGLFGDVTTTTITDEPDTDALDKAYSAMSKTILKTDIQKANESVPSLMVVNFVTIVEGGNKVINTAVIGVKARLQYVSSQDMVNRIVLKHADRRGLVNFIRATTGEIKFFKDFLFAIDRAKVDAVAKSGKGSNSKIWKMLELTAHKAKLNKAAGIHNASAAAITTLVINQAEVDLIKKEHRIDLMKPGTLLSVMKGYNIMAAVIIDEVDEKCLFLYDDGSKVFETLSFMSLEREEGNGMYKKVINLMTKGR